jgi:hypothetical protein
MTRRFPVVPVLALALSTVLATGCSRHEAASSAGSGRKLAEVWKEILAQRDLIHGVFMKPLEEVTHQDCADLGAAARQIDALTNEIGNAVTANGAKLDSARMRSIGVGVNRISQVTQRIREVALIEAPGAWPELRFPLDQSLRGFEGSFSPEELGGESVTLRPGFETQPLPAPLSPV